MPKKYKLLLCLSIAAILLILYSTNTRPTLLSSKINPLPVKKMKARKSADLANLANNEEMVATILVMPKSYLPALMQFSKSKMAKEMTFLEAQIEIKDGQVTAIHSKKKKQPGRKTLTAANPSNKPDKTKLEQTPDIKKQVLSAGLLIFLASIHKGRLFR